MNLLTWIIFNLILNIKTMKNLLYIIAGICVIIWIAWAFGLINYGVGVVSIAFLLVIVIITIVRILNDKNKQE